MQCVSGAVASTASGRSARRGRGLLLGGCALALTAALTACQSDGGDEGGSSDGEGSAARGTVTKTLNAATQKTEKAESAKVDVAVTTSGLGGSGGGMETMKVSGVQSWSPTAADMTMDLGALEELGAPSRMQVRVVDGTAYVDVGSKLAAQFDGKRWLKVSPAQAGAQLGGVTDGSQQQDPSQQMNLLLASPNVKKVGKESIRGEETTHYRGSLTVEEALKSGGEAHDAELRKQLKELKKQGIGSLDINVWVGKDDLPVRTESALKGDKGSVKAKADFSDYGTAVDVQAPPAAETTDLGEMGGADGPGGENSRALTPAL